jgi:hypothetical protein
VKVFPKLSRVIKEDAKILLNEDIDFDFLFHNSSDKSSTRELMKVSVSVFFLPAKIFLKDESCLFLGQQRQLFSSMRRLEQRQHTLLSY